MSIQTKKKFNEIMPNEILRTILVKLEANPQIAIRSVCHRWKLLIESICLEKRTLVFRSARYSTNEVKSLSKQFNCLVDIGKRCAVLKLQQHINQDFKIEFYSYFVSRLSDNLCALLVQLFPKIENLVFNLEFDIRYYTTRKNLFALLKHWSSSIVTLLLPSSKHFYKFYDKLYLPELFDLIINNLTSLRRLDFWAAKSSDMVPLLSLDRLQHCGVSDKNILGIIPHLGPSCTSLRLTWNLSLKNITRWPKLNSHLVQSLTHLSLNTSDQQVLSFVCDKFVSLTFLRFCECLGQNMILNADTFAHLARLSKLSQLSLEHFKLDMTTLDETRSNLATLNSVQTLLIYLTNYDEFGFDQFCRIMASIFPNIEQLTIKHQNSMIREKKFSTLRSSFRLHSQTCGSSSY